jgi:anti-sigma regulatory factor (Ser/Thr protein kinase)
MRELSLHILDVLENAVEAGASNIEIRIDEDRVADQLVIEIGDNGRGMHQERVLRVLDPFYTTRKTRHVGLGLPLFREAAHRCEGDLVIQSEPGKGTRVRATFRRSHIDRAPLGDMPMALLAILLSEQPVDVIYTRRVDSREFRFDSSEVRRELENIPLTHPKVREWLVQFLREGEATLVPETRGKDSLPFRDGTEAVEQAKEGIGWSN